jgi:hypothetical protein
MNKIKDIINIYDNDFTKKLIEHETVLDEILISCNNKWHFGCGSYLFEGINYDYSIDMYPKQKLLFDVTKKVSKVLEIGVYMAHSLFIMLLANPELEVTCIDIDSAYSIPSINVLKKNFPKSKINFIKGNSLDVIPTLNNNYDLFHIDGSHYIDVIRKEFDLCLKLSKNEKLKFVFDDVDCCRLLQNEINSNFNIVKSLEAGGAYTNLYIEFTQQKC